MNKNWLIDSRVGSKLSFNLVKLIENDLDSEEDFKKFESFIEKCEIINI